MGKAHVAVAAEVLEQLDLAESSLGENLLAKDIGDLLDGDALIGLVVDGSAIEGVTMSAWRGRVGARRKANGGGRLTRQYRRRPVQAPW